MEDSIFGNYFFSGKGDKIINVSNIVDPLNELNFQYVVRSLSDEDFRIDFAFEIGIGGLAPGNYILTRQGISQ